MKKSEQHIFRKKIKEYEKILKEDRDWDWAYILMLLKYKLERTRKCIVSNNIIQNNKKVGREIKQVEVLLDRVLKDGYFEVISKDFNKKYGRIRMKFIKSDLRPNTSQMKTYFKNETPKNSKIIHREFLRLHGRADKMRYNELKKAFDLMSKNIWGWWD